ncbi:hypothetical protein TGPRC2_426260 [Toxoplasma gondii TgCatPRC2]|uniref:PH domain-containing protein n=1 Tax=Toxoplasma gondii TgCatPRC2 TaxID=1130821 RepID=A0A151H5H8_TOXGO|nr:hypothetical protein TGPRC2_426260 [Toxoplasma gondii TgCatPRC2]
MEDNELLSILKAGCPFFLAERRSRESVTDEAQLDPTNSVNTCWVKLHPSEEYLQIGCVPSIEWNEEQTEFVDMNETIPLKDVVEVVPNVDGEANFHSLTIFTKHEETFELISSVHRDFENWLAGLRLLISRCTASVSAESSEVANSGCYNPDMASANSFIETLQDQVADQTGLIDNLSEEVLRLSSLQYRRDEAIDNIINALQNGGVGSKTARDEIVDEEVRALKEEIRELRHFLRKKDYLLQEFQRVLPRSRALTCWSRSQITKAGPSSLNVESDRGRVCHSSSPPRCRLGYDRLTTFLAKTTSIHFLDDDTAGHTTSVQVLIGLQTSRTTSAVITICGGTTLTMAASEKEIGTGATAAASIATVGTPQDRQKTDKRPSCLLRPTCAKKFLYRDARDTITIIIITVIDTTRDQTALLEAVHGRAREKHTHAPDTIKTTNPYKYENI